MRITNIAINLLDGSSNLKATALVTFDDIIMVWGFHIVVQENGGRFIAWPQRQLPSKRWVDTVKCTDQKFKAEVESRIKKEYLELTGEE